MRGFDEHSPQQNFFREFMPWTSWSTRWDQGDGHGHKVHDYPGVYVLAHFDERPPEGSADYLHEEVVYVGEASWLKRRWEQFETSALHGKGGHSGGLEYKRRIDSTWWARLHVAALPIWFGEETLPRSAEDWTQTYRLYVERRILWELTVRRGGTHRLLNRK